MSRLPLVPLLLTCGALLAGCATPAAAPTPQRNPDLSQLRSKIDLIQQDECVTRRAADVYPSCPRFIGEVAAVAEAARQVVGAPASLTAAAGMLGNDSTAFTGAGCVPMAGATPAPPQTCAATLEKIRTDLTAVSTALNGVT